MPGKYPTNRQLAADLQAFVKEQGLTNSKLVRMLGIPKLSAEFLSRYFNDKLDRVVPDFDVLAADILKNLREREANKTRIFDSTVTTKIVNAINLIQRAGHIGAIVGPAGHGKTTGMELALAKNPSAIFITLSESLREGSHIESLIMSKIDGSSWDGRSSRFSFLTQRFKESGRPILIDNWQRLNGSGRRWLFDFHDQTDSPICCVGNPEALKPILKNDQFHRRLGLCTTYQLESQEIQPLSYNVTCQFADEETADQVSDLVSFIGHKDGALGSVIMAVKLMQTIREHSAELRDNPRKALRSAHSRLARNYTLPED